MKLVVRFLALGCAVALAALPLLQGSAAQAATITVPATVSASNWTAMPNTETAPSTGNFSDSVSCVNSDFCMGVGANGNYSSSYYAETWNGTTWAPSPLPTISADEFELSQVSCVTASFCVAVGFADYGSTETPLLLTWNGTSWTLVQGGSAASTPTSLGGVACTSVIWCVAVGSGGTDEGGLYAELWNGSTWAPTTAPTPSGDEGLSVGAVSCTTPAYCMAVGNVGNGSTDGAWSALWNGTSWTTEAMPSTTTTTTMTSVSCVGIAGFCTAVGYTEMTGPPTYENAILNWNGSTWALEPPVPSTPPAFGQFLIGVSCFSATSCTAVGGVWTDSGGSTQVTEAFTWNGQSWSAAASPNATGAVETSFTGVDCVTNWACVAVGTSQATSTANEQPFNAMAPIARSGYRFVASDGGIFNYGAGAPFLGSMGGQHLNAPIVGMATMPAGDGYYLAASDGGVFNFGSAQFFGSAGSLHLNAPIVGIAVTPDGGGYWLVASDGGIFSYGDAQFYGSMGGKPLNKPIVGIASLPNGDGYYLVASDGGLFTFPTGPQGPPFLGSTGSITLNKPVVGMAVTPSGQYYLVASDGGIFSFPDTPNGPPFYGSTGSIVLNKPVIGMTVTAGGAGYYLGAADGGIFSFPTGATGPPFYGSRGGQPLNAPIVGIAG
jgi:hypothetical protein